MHDLFPCLGLGCGDAGGYTYLFGFSGDLGSVFHCSLRFLDNLFRDDSSWFLLPEVSFRYQDENLRQIAYLFKLFDGPGCTFGSFFDSLRFFNDSWWAVTFNFGFWLARWRRIGGFTLNGSSDLWFGLKMSDTFGNDSFPRKLTSLTSSADGSATTGSS